MKFEKFWSKIHSLDNFVLQTLTHQKEFTATYDQRYDLIEIIPATNQPRPVTKDQFYKVWQIAKNSVNPFKTIHYQKTTYNSSYIVTIMKHFLNGEKIE